MSDNMNNTSTVVEATKDIDITVADIILCIAAQLISAFIIFVNSLTIVVVRRTHSLQTLSNIYVVSLAVSDLVVGICLIPLSLFYIPHIRSTYYDKNVNFCVLVFGIILGMALVSSLNMALIAIDRYAYIIHPYKYQKMMDRKFICVILVAIWIFGVFYSLLPQIIHNDQSKVYKCDITLAMPKEYLFYATSSIYTICVIIDVSMYTHILCVAYKQRRSIESTAPAVDTGPRNSLSVYVTENSQFRDTGFCENNGHSTVVPDSNSQAIKNGSTHRPSVHIPEQRNNARKKHRSRMKSVRFFLTVFGVYFVCLTPTVVCMGIDYYTTIQRFLYNMFNLLALLNSGMNFIIFYILNANFKAAVLKLLGRKTSVSNATSQMDGSYLDG